MEVICIVCETSLVSDTHAISCMQVILQQAICQSIIVNKPFKPMMTYNIYNGNISIAIIIFNKKTEQYIRVCMAQSTEKEQLFTYAKQQYNNIYNFIVIIKIPTKIDKTTGKLHTNSELLNYFTYMMHKSNVKLYFLHYPINNNNNVYQHSMHIQMIDNNIHYADNNGRFLNVTSL